MPIRSKTPMPCPPLAGSLFFFFHRRHSKPSADRAFVFTGANASSLLLNIPDWSKILRNEYRDNRSRDSVDYDDVDGDDESPKRNLGKKTGFQD
ncbi:hypothetical protein FH972_027282 [Carpinus fangiana]|uniref:Uncharacterized protein n=1 Tax=Carpinus fangiana TaxID=176857 RepID=A0A5N6LE59_9ROSI|nr:hypothetical protein FH972_027282 [Carpinus fangiana]